MGARKVTVGFRRRIRHQLRKCALRVQLRARWNMDAPTSRLSFDDIGEDNGLESLVVSLPPPPPQATRRPRRSGGTSLLAKSGLSCGLVHGRPTIDVRPYHRARGSCHRPIKASARLRGCRIRYQSGRTRPAPDCPPDVSETTSDTTLAGYAAAASLPPDGGKVLADGVPSPQSAHPRRAALGWTSDLLRPSGPAASDGRSAVEPPPEINTTNQDPSAVSPRPALGERRHEASSPGWHSRCAGRLRHDRNG